MLPVPKSLVDQLSTMGLGVPKLFDLFLLLPSLKLLLLIKLFFEHFMPFLEIFGLTLNS